LRRWWLWRSAAWFDFVAAAPAQVVRVRYWDKASVGGGGDWSCGVRMAKSADGVYYVEDVVRGRWSSLQRNEVIRATAQRDGRGVEVVLEQEPGSGGKESAEISVRELAGFVVSAERVTGDKETRARPLSSQCEARNVKIVVGAGGHAPGWVEPFLHELHGFPLGAFDDQVDAASGAFNKLAVRSVSMPVEVGPRRSSFGGLSFAALGPSPFPRGFPWASGAGDDWDDEVDQNGRRIPSPSDLYGGGGS
jgi:predicted phage terminase large subunit-like protein